MTVRINKSAFNIRDKLSELERPIGVKGNELMRAETLQDARDLVSAGRKNLIINGAMQVAQRGTVVNAGNEYGGPDRMRFNKNDGAFTISQSTDVPSGQGFGYSWKADVTSVAGTSGNYYTLLQHRFEGQNLQSLKKGTSFAESFTLQFWIKSAVTGTYVVEVYDNDNNRSISQSYTVNSANTWEHKILTFPGDATGALDNDNNDSLEINCWLFAGSGYSSGTLNTSWNTQNDANRAVGQVNAANNTSNDIYFTGFQLEVGKNATEFEHRSYGEELALCQRYFLNPLQNTNNSRSTYPIIYSSADASSGWTVFQVPFPVAMRVPPSLSHNISDSNFVQGGPSTTQWAFYRQNQAYPGKQGGNNMSVLNASSNTTQANVGAYYVSPNSDTSAILFGSDLTFQFSAEL